MIRLVVFVESFFLLGAAGVWRVASRASAGEGRRGWVKYAAYFAIVHTVLACFWFGKIPRLALTALIVTAGLVEIVSVRRRANEPLMPSAAFVAAVVVYLAAAGGTLRVLATHNGQFAVVLYVTIAAFDGFAQLAGQNLGRRPIAPRLSPNKTLEGVLGGFVGAEAAAMALGPLAGWTLSSALVAGAILGLGALGGDLLASGFKRAHRVKDFGAVLPGQGGILDRFDSLLGGALAFLLVAA